LIEITEPYTHSQGEESILYNFDSGRAFGINKLAKDIEGLDQYYMSSYFPNSEMKETWMFEIEAHYGGSQLIEIVHLIDQSYESHWKLAVAEVERGSSEPQIIAKSGSIKGYQDFIKTVNSRLYKLINPDSL
jgi:hypothetical protein